MSNTQLISDLEKIVGARHVLTTPSATHRFRKGFRFGDGPALAVVRPGSLVEMWRTAMQGKTETRKEELSTRDSRIEIFAGVATA